MVDVAFSVPSTEGKKKKISHRGNAVCDEGKKKSTHGRRLHAVLLAMGRTAENGWYHDVGRTATRRIVRMVNHVLGLRRERP